MALLDTEKLVWYYDSNDGPDAEGSKKPLTLPQWTEYLDIDADIIEDAYQAGRESVDLNRYRIDLKSLEQVRIDDNSKRRAVKRATVSGLRHRIPSTRFTGPEVVQTVRGPTTFNGFDTWCPFLQAWLKTPLGKRVLKNLQACIEPCAQGIIQEAARDPVSRHIHAAFITKKLRQCSGESRREVSELCVTFYTRDCFLYSVLNRALRECDLTKLETLGPYAYLLHNHARTGKEYCGIVYRGTQLAPAHVEEYRKALGTWKSWPAYTSASRYRLIAEAFGNTLFIITLTGGLPTTPRGFDVSKLSAFSNEGEIVIPPGNNFLIQSIDEDSQGKSIIHLRI